MGNGAAWVRCRKTARTLCLVMIASTSSFYCVVLVGIPLKRRQRLLLGLVATITLAAQALAVGAPPSPWNAEQPAACAHGFRALNPPLARLCRFLMVVWYC